MDAGALIALERGAPRVRALLSQALQQGREIAVPVTVVAQVWRDGAQQARIARLLAAPEVGVVPLDRAAAQLCGVLLGLRRRRDVVDVSVVVCARLRSHAVVTADPDDISHLDARLTVIAI